MKRIFEAVLAGLIGAVLLTLMGVGTALAVAWAKHEFGALGAVAVLFVGLVAIIAASYAQWDAEERQKSRLATQPSPDPQSPA